VSRHTDGGDDSGLRMRVNLVVCHVEQRNVLTLRRNLFSAVGSWAVVGLRVESHSSWERMPSAGSMVVVVVVDGQERCCLKDGGMRGKELIYR
jgi:hypothetical protein